VLEVQLSGFAGDNSIRVATIVDNTTRCSVKKKMVALADNTLTIVDDITVNFIKHRLN
jgi:hypothetical protein